MLAVAAAKHHLVGAQIMARAMSAASRAAALIPSDVSTRRSRQDDFRKPAVTIRDEDLEEGLDSRFLEMATILFVTSRVCRSLWIGFIPEGTDMPPPPPDADGGPHIPSCRPTYICLYKLVSPSLSLTKQGALVCENLMSCVTTSQILPLSACGSTLKTQRLKTQRLFSPNAHLEKQPGQEAASNKSSPIPHPC